MKWISTKLSTSYKSIAFLIVLIIVACTGKTIYYRQTENSCIEPDKIDYVDLNNRQYNDEIYDRVKEWPDYLSQYLLAKIKNRLEQQELCEIHALEQFQYAKCLLYLIKNKEEIEKNDANEKSNN